MDIVSRLEKMGYEVPGPVSTGKDAIKLALEVKPDIILMDIVIKGPIDGIEAAKRINNLFDIPIIFVTAYSDDEIIQKAKKTVPYGYIIKPFKDRDLYGMIEVAIYKHEIDRKSRKSKEEMSEAGNS